MIQLNILKAEFIKSKSFVSLWVLFLYPLLVVLLHGIGYFFGNPNNFKDDIWPIFFEDLIGTWSFMFLPIYCALNVYSVFSVEDYTNNWKNLFSMGVSRNIILNHKFTIALLYNLIGNISLFLYGFILMFFLNYIKPEIPVFIDIMNPINIKLIFILFTCSLGIIMFYSIIVLWVQSVIYPFILFVFMSFFNLFIVLKKISIYYPLSAPGNAIHKLFGKEQYSIYVWISITIFFSGILILNLIVNKYFNKSKL
jgi:hypothetical protein